MDQLTLDDFIPVGKELILCSLSEGFHWIRITSGKTPEAFVDRVQFTLNDYEYLYENTSGKDEVISEFDGELHVVSWGNAMGGEMVNG